MRFIPKEVVVDPDSLIPKKLYIVADEIGELKTAVESGDKKYVRGFSRVVENSAVDFRDEKWRLWYPIDASESVPCLHCVHTDSPDLGCTQYCKDYNDWEERNIPSNNGWISGNNPGDKKETFHDYLVTEEGVDGRFVDLLTWVDGVWYWGQSPVESSSIIAYMPLPVPYEK